MQKISIVIGVYALFVLSGGLFGYFIAQSVPSLVMGSTVSFVLLVCSLFLWLGHHKVYYLTIGILLSLLAFFGLRFIWSHNFMPSGFMSSLTIGVLLYLAVYGKIIRRSIS